MAAFIPFLFLVLFGAMVFALTSGLTQIEEHRAQGTAIDKPLPHSVRPGLRDERCVACGALQGGLACDDVLAQLEERVRIETIAVSGFVERPSVESLHWARGARDAAATRRERN